MLLAMGGCIMKKHTTEAEVVADIHAHESHRHVGMPAAGASAGAVIGAAIGSIAGPPGAIAGALVGGAIGAASGAAIDVDETIHDRHDAELDDDIGVTSGDLGSRPPPPPATRSTAPEKG